MYFIVTVQCTWASYKSLGEPQSICFTIIGDRQCGILLVDVGRLVACIPTIHAVRGYTGEMKIVHCTQCGY